ncbi:unnamed protein product [Colias eurytheme]|nr:unnamed protein product [Colias eurytheme]
MKIANRVLVFMIKGIKKNFKQPVANFFTQSLQKYVHKITEEHIHPEEKKRLKMATQIFSHSAVVATENLTARKNLADEWRQLIPVVLLLDKLFDS